MKCIRIIGTELGNIITRIDQLKVVASDTLIILTKDTAESLLNTGSGIHEITEDPITHVPYKNPITEFNLYTVYKLAIQKFQVGEMESGWYALTGMQLKTYSAQVAKNIVIVELVDRMPTINIDEQY